MMWKISNFLNSGISTFWKNNPFKLLLVWTLKSIAILIIDVGCNVAKGCLSYLIGTRVQASGRFWRGRGADSSKYLNILTCKEERGVGDKTTSQSSTNQYRGVGGIITCIIYFTLISNMLLKSSGGTPCLFTFYM